MKKIALALFFTALITECRPQPQVPDPSVEKLYVFLKEWWKVPYRWGGNTKLGIDCSAFVKKMYQTLHDKNIPRTSREQYRVAKKIKREELQTGDLLFFKNRRGVWHVGYYMFDSLFAHSSTTQRGVAVSSLNNAAYKKMWFSQGRFD